MSYVRVIQDSDDEDDPLSELPPAQSHRIPTTNEDTQDRVDGHQAHDGDHGFQIGVNFDEFLQPKDAVQFHLTEDRWIPSVERADGIGTVMTEISLAQQRLLDDDRQVVPSESHPAQLPADIEPTLEPNSNEGTAYITYGNGADRLNSCLNVSGEPHNTVSSSEWSQSAPSYNLFESSSMQPSSCHLNRADFLQDPIQPGPMLNSPRRWNSMEATPYSPHDTIPFSSVVSPKVTRTKSDSVAMPALQPSQTSVDELAMPIVVEIPGVEKKPLRKKKLSIPDNDEDDELAQPANTHEVLLNNPEKRRPGRPPKNQKVLPDQPSITGPTNDIVASATCLNGQEMAPGPGISPLSNGLAENQFVQPQVIINGSKKVHQESPTGAFADTKTADTDEASKKLAKGPKKKKLKRGKTTSVTLKKTYESDVENDVIWVDEKPILPLAQNQQPTTVSIESDNKNIPEPVAPAPKKRGRKRKQTSEQLGAEGAAISQPKDDQTPLRPLDGNDQTLSAIPDTENKTYPTRTTDPQTHDLSAITEEPLCSPIKTSTSVGVDAVQPPETPKKANAQKTPAKGPTKHSPISSTTKVPYRVGLSRRARIAPLLKIVKR